MGAGYGTVGAAPCGGPRARPHKLRITRHGINAMARSLRCSSLPPLAFGHLPLTGGVGPIGPKVPQRSRKGKAHERRNVWKERLPNLTGTSGNRNSPKFMPAPNKFRTLSQCAPRVRVRRPGDLWVLSIPGKYLARGRNIPRRSLTTYNPPPPSRQHGAAGVFSERRPP